MSYTMRVVILSLVGAVLGAPVVRACGPFFYEAAPPISKEEMSFAIKTLADLYDRATFPTWKKEEAEALAAELTKSGLEGLRLPPAEAKPRFEALLKKNREGAYRASTANFLHDLLDLSQSADIPAEQREAYARWRLSLADLDKGIPTEQAGRGQPVEPPDWWDDADKQALIDKQKARDKAFADLMSSVEENLKTASPNLQPHWLVQKGGLLFRACRFAEAQQVFQSVGEKFPDHPRVETADYMAARCQIEIARDAERGRKAGDSGEHAETDQAMDMLTDFTSRYPDGRFTAEVPGWEAALQVMGKNYGSAFCDYIVQSQVEGHPEVARQALHEAERCLLRMGEDIGRDDHSLATAADLLANFPAAAMRTVYFFLEPAGTVDYNIYPWNADGMDEGDGKTKNRLARRWRLRADGTHFLRDLARALVESHRPGDEWDPFALAAAAWAASETGDHATALALCGKHKELLEKSDDLLTVRAIALQRTAQTEEAIKTWRLLVEKFPKSPLAAQANQRLVALLHDARRDAEALAVACASAPERETRFRWEMAEESNKSAFTPDRPEFLAEDMRQWADTLALMTPLDELVREWEKATVPVVKQRMAAYLARRALIDGRLDLARLAFNEAPKPEKSEDDPDIGQDLPAPRPGPMILTADFAKERIDPLADRMAAASKATGDESARAWTDLGKEWVALYREFTLPELLSDYMNSDFRRLGFRLRQNAITLGYPLPQVNDVLSRQDLLAPALDCWKRALEAAPESPAAAEALFHSNEALRQRAESDPFLMALADERDDSAKSTDLVRRLRAHPAGGLWARQAVEWDFKDVEWLPGNNPPNQVDQEVAEVILARDSEKPVLTDEKDLDVLPMLDEALNTGTLEAAKQKLVRFRARAVAGLAPDGDPSVVNALDDAAVVFDVPGISLADVRAYLGHLVVLRGQGAQADPLPASVADLADYLHLRSSLDAENPAAWKQWADEHPKSLRRESALFQYLRLTCRKHRGWTRFANVSWPDGPLPGSRYPGIKVNREAEADPTAMRSLIAEFEKEFPKSRYAGSIALLKAGAAIDAKDYREAVGLLSPLLEDATHRDLHLDASLLLCDAFFRVFRPEDRPAVIEAVLRCPPAIAQFRRLMESRTVGGRLAVFRKCFPSEPESK